VQGLVEDREFVEALISAVELVAALSKRSKLEAEQEQESKHDE